jgi:uncharacterized protein involved in exopolysaccharide biosynthesis
VLAAKDQDSYMSGLDYVSVIRYEKYWFLIVSAMVALLGTLVIFLLPVIYVAQSEILIERDGSYSSESAENQRDDLGHRVHAIIRTILTSENIEALLRKHGEVANDATDQELRDAINRFRSNTRLDFDNVDIVNRLTGREGKYSLGLVLQHENQSADVAYQVALDLSDMLLNSNIGEISNGRDQRLSFLHDQSRVLLEALRQSEEAIAEFKDENAMFLPDLYPIVVTRYKDLEAKPVQLDDNLLQLKRSENELLADLAASSRDAFLYAADGARVLGPEEKLIQLELEYAEKASKYSGDHPETIRLRNEIEGLKHHITQVDTGSLEAELQTARLRLASKKEIYTDAHPDIKALNIEISELEKRIGSVESGGAPRSTSTPTNPSYNRVMTRLEGVRYEIQQETSRQEELAAELDTVRNQLQRIPYIEQALLTLERKRDLINNKYSEVEKQLVEVELSSEMGKADLLDRFVLLEPPFYPVSPSKPKKKILLAVVLIMALSIGYLVAILVFWYRDKIRNSGDLEQLTDVPVYMIPQLG